MIGIDTIIATVAVEFGVTELDMRSARRGAQIVRARHVAMYLARNLTLRSYPQIAHAFGNRDHTTAMYGVRRADQEIHTDPALSARVVALRFVLTREDLRCRCA